MPKFIVHVERKYTARHVAEVIVEAENAEEAEALVEAQLESGECDPSADGDYTDTNTDDGYDDAGTWEVDPDHTEEAKGV